MRSYLISALLASTWLASSQTVRLQLKFPKGDVQRVGTSMTMKMDFAMGQSMNMTMKQAEDAIERVVGSAPGGGGTVKVTIGKAVVSMDMNGKPSPMPGSANAEQGQTMTLQFLPNGRIAKIAGLEEIIKKSAQGNPAAGMMGGMNDKSMTDMMNLSYGGILPDHPVRVGDKWSGDMSFSQAPMEIRFHLNSKLLRLESHQGHRMAIIGMTGSGSMNMSGMPTQGGQVSMKTDRFEVTGTLVFDIDRGWFRTSDMVMKIHATMKASGQAGAKSVAMGIDMTTRSTYTPAR